MNRDEEINLILNEKEDREAVLSLLIYYPITWDIIKDMLAVGLQINQIKAICVIWCSKGYPIESSWNATKLILSTIRGK